MSTKFDALLAQRKASVEATATKLHQALDRFEQKQLVALPPDAKLSIRNLALEAGVSKDTPLSRYRPGHANNGEYRFPKVVKRFRRLKIKLSANKTVNSKDETIKKLRIKVNLLDEKLLLAARVINQKDIEVSEVRQRIRELEQQNAKLRQDSLKVVPIK